MPDDSESFGTRPARIQDWLTAIDSPQPQKLLDSSRARPHHPQMNRTLDNDEHGNLAKYCQHPYGIDDNNHSASRKVSQWLNSSQEIVHSEARNIRKDSHRRIKSDLRSRDIHGTQPAKIGLRRRSDTESFERRGRHKTRRDRYDAKKAVTREAKKRAMDQEKSTGLSQTEAQPKASSQPKLRSHKDIMDRFDSEAISSSNRLTVQPSPIPGLFLNSRAASSMGFVPDLAYNPMTHFSRATRRFDADTLHTRLAKCAREGDESSQSPVNKEELENGLHRDAKLGRCHVEVEDTVEQSACSSCRESKSQSQTSIQLQQNKTEISPIQYQPCPETSHTRDTPQVEERKQRADDGVAKRIDACVSPADPTLGSKLSEALRSDLVATQQWVRESLEDVDTGRSCDAGSSVHSHGQGVVDLEFRQRASLSTTTARVPADRQPDKSVSSIPETMQVESAGMKSPNVSQPNLQDGLNVGLDAADDVENLQGLSKPEMAMYGRTVRPLAQYKDIGCQTEDGLFSHTKTRQETMQEGLPSKSQLIGHLPVSEIGRQERVQQVQFQPEVAADDLPCNRPQLFDLHPSFAARPHQHTGCTKHTTSESLPNDGSVACLEGNNDVPMEGYRALSGDNMPVTETDSVFEGSWPAAVAETSLLPHDSRASCSWAMLKSFDPQSHGYPLEQAHQNHEILQPQAKRLKVEVESEGLEQFVPRNERGQIYEVIDEAHEEMTRFWRPNRW
ncbi:hypothetical protein HOO65_020601 [Ceratocystis lukuohia]|uniref:Uncharacterized protein n=1 Tax=Ceratocystis lukuohia TaxID=2019550 RepID=A0ABR4MPC1_9PEZI